MVITVTIALTGCGSLPAEKGMPMSDVFNSGNTSYNQQGALDTLREGIRSDFTRLGDSPVRPMVRPMALMPIWIPQKKFSSTTINGGRWIYESVDDGGIVDP